MDGKGNASEIWPKYMHDHPIYQIGRRLLGREASAPVRNPAEAFRSKPSNHLIRGTP